PPCPPLLPYTTLFRSSPADLPPQTRLDRRPPNNRVRRSGHLPLDRADHRLVDQEVRPHRPPLQHHPAPSRRPHPHRGRPTTRRRSEEHTSELQSRENL